MIQLARMIGTRRGTIVVSHDRPARRHRAADDTLFVSTPLEVIARLEHDRDRIGTVVLTGTGAASRELAAFLVESYPALQIMTGRAGEEPDCYLPAFA